eukprot:Awhi_evm1s6009
MLKNENVEEKAKQKVLENAAASSSMASSPSQSSFRRFQQQQHPMSSSSSSTSQSFRMDKLVAKREISHFSYDEGFVE